MTQEIVLQNNKRLCECGCGQEILELISKHRGESKQAADRYIKLYKNRINNRLVAGRKSKTRLKLQAFELDSKAVKEINDKKYGINHHLNALS